MTTLALIQNLNWIEILALLALGVLLFGRKLPEVGRSLGKGIVEFKKGLKGIGDDIETESSRTTPANYSEPANVYRPPLNAAGVDARVSQPSAAPVSTQAPATPSN